MLSALAAGAVALAIAASLWALAEQRGAQRLRRALRSAGARTQAAVGERDALLSAGREALVVWGRDGSGPFSYGGGEALLDSCLKGADALALSQALDALSDKGISFQIPVHDAHGRKLVARGRAVGSMAAVWLEEPSIAGADHRFPRHPGRAADPGLAARQGAGADLGQSRLPQRHRFRRSGHGAARPGLAGQKRTAISPPTPAARM